MSVSTSEEARPSRVVVHEGDLFANAPERSVLVHACNTVGVWGSGIAAEFKRRYPDAFRVYHEACLKMGEDLLGTCLLIPAGERDVACLFTSKRYGKAVDPPETVLKSTRNAVRDLLAQLEGSDKPIYGCRINAGRFRVPWEDTVAVLDELGLSMTVYEIVPLEK